MEESEEIRKKGGGETVGDKRQENEKITLEKAECDNHSLQCRRRKYEPAVPGLQSLQMSSCLGCLRTLSTHC